MDIKTTAHVLELVRDLSDGGTSVLLISRDLREMVMVADRILVMEGFVLRGEVANTCDCATVSEGIMHHIHGATEAAQ